MAVPEIFHGIEVQQKQFLAASERLNIVVVGAGLGGLGAAIALLLAGHEVHVLESASQIGEVGAGIQALPNSSRVLIQWGLGPRLTSLATIPLNVEMLGWKGNIITQYDFTTAAKQHGAPFWDFHRADLHGALLERAQELGCIFQTKARVVDVDTTDETAKVLLSSGESIEADLVVGADGIHSRCREIMLGGPSPPVTTGDLAYRVLLSTEGMRDDPDLAPFLATHHVRYWMGPGAHAVSYVLRHGKLINIVLLVPDDMPEGASTMDASVEEMQALFAQWDIRIPKLLKYCQSVQKWRLCYRPGLEQPWSNPASTFALLGDAVHATLPYLASGAGMALEDAAVLGHCFARIKDRLPQAKRKVYEQCRRARTESIVDRSNVQQYLYHIDDGEEQEARDSRFRIFGKIEEEIQDEGVLPGIAQLPDGLEVGSDPLAWRRYGVGTWLISYDCLGDVQRHWPGEQVACEASHIRASL
ncbi:Putative FAD-binding domain, FAD/NAD(P)-binding domain superfamily [Septoria linicola]|uniref:FAD-binding domain, FAD/NAD(P)-binding domain superfamily n=1 Tax=Septoria linicola TaxID=215465 RepID=A0A9Q9ASM1_9PEZI|nr:putative FAD-binding domain, FAD/NAD(P)-binding domain superfamily [Septoria linicola]USW51267.1 Putative FAD-binding domain, FAD/NAD(P)-binding domain superfamily [Septoria linicola]